MKYALLAYTALDAHDRAPDADRGPIEPHVLAVLERPDVSGWLRLRPVESATTVRHEHGRTLLTDGPFVESKEFLAGVIVVEAENLDGALAIARELQEPRAGGAIEVRPILEDQLRSA